MRSLTSFPKTVYTLLFLACTVPVIYAATSGSLEGLFTGGTLNGGNIFTNSITDAQLAPGSVTADKIASDAVGALQIDSSSVQKRVSTVCTGDQVLTVSSVGILSCITPQVCKPETKPELCIGDSTTYVTNAQCDIATVIGSIDCNATACGTAAGTCNIGDPNLPVGGIDTTCGATNTWGCDITVPGGKCIEMGPCEFPIGGGACTFKCLTYSEPTTNTVNCTKTNPACSVITGVCGTSNGGTFSTAPTTNLCSIGTATVVSGTGPWTWTCKGSDDTVTTDDVACSASKQSSPSCICPSGQSQCSGDPTKCCTSKQEYCCTNKYGGKVSPCSTTTPPTSCSYGWADFTTETVQGNCNAATGACGSAAGGSFAAAPTTGLCNNTSAVYKTNSMTAPSPDLWTWICTLSASGVDKPCEATRTCSGTCDSYCDDTADWFTGTYNTSTCTCDYVNQGYRAACVGNVKTCSTATPPVMNCTYRGGGPACDECGSGEIHWRCNNDIPLC